MNPKKETALDCLLKAYPQADRERIATAFNLGNITPNDPLITLMVALQSRETQAVLSPAALREVAEQALARIQATQNETVNHLECIARRMESASGEWFNLSQAAWGFSVAMFFFIAPVSFLSLAIPGGIILFLYGMSLSLVLFLISFGKPILRFLERRNNPTEANSYRT